MINQIEDLPEDKIPELTEECREWLDADLCHSTDCAQNMSDEKLKGLLQSLLPVFHRMSGVWRGRCDD